MAKSSILYPRYVNPMSFFPTVLTALLSAKTPTRPFLISDSLMVVRWWCQVGVKHARRHKEEVEVEFPKKDIFTVGSSKIGAESLKFIQNGALYQVFSVLIKTAMSAPTWEELYKKFMHPAGFFIGARITSDNEASLSGTAQGFINDQDSGALTIIAQAAGIAFAPFTQMTQLLDSDGNGTSDFRIDLNELVSTYQTLTLTQLNKFYGSFGEIASPNSFKFDDSDKGDSAGTARPDFSLTTETMDNEMFSNYLIDSTF